MKTHNKNCTSVKRSVCALPQLPAAATNTFVQPTSIPAPIREPLSNLRIDAMTPEQQKSIDEKLALAVHTTAKPFSFFNSPVWKTFFQSLRPAYKLPSSKSIGGELLSDAYQKCMQEVFLHIRNNKGGVVGIDGGTNKLSKSVSNVIIHALLPLFVEYLRSDLKTDRTSNVVLKIKDAMKRLDDIIGFKAGYKRLKCSDGAMGAALIVCTIWLKMLEGFLTLLRC
ncbi:hypothetical protein FGB62_64g020 [Gracilaria domingensis]|nr:hypothetical protein FGB62_64g020 [Gracilaria domingensis]